MNYGWHCSSVVCRLNVVVLVRNYLYWKCLPVDKFSKPDVVKLLKHIYSIFGVELSKGLL